MRSVTTLVPLPEWPLRRRGNDPWYLLHLALWWQRFVGRA